MCRIRFPNDNSRAIILVMPGFGPAAERACLARPEGGNYHLMRLEERNLCVEQKAPKPLMPRLASSQWADPRLRGGILYQ